MTERDSKAHAASQSVDIDWGELSTGGDFPTENGELFPKHFCINTCACGCKSDLTPASRRNYGGFRYLFLEFTARRTWATGVDERL
jgi:hypothetical protein